MRSLIVYFSQTGHTRMAAEKLAETIDSDIFEIKPKISFTEKDLDGYNESSRTYKEQHNQNSRPAIKSLNVNLDKYDRIFIGYPIWWHIAPRLIFTFLGSANLKEKEIIPFATSYESTIERSCEKLKVTFPQLNWGKGKLLNHIKTEDLKDWIKS